MQTLGAAINALPQTMAPARRPGGLEELAGLVDLLRDPDAVAARLAELRAHADAADAAVGRVNDGLTEIARLRREADEQAAAQAAEFDAREADLAQREAAAQAREAAAGERERRAVAAEKLTIEREATAEEARRAYLEKLRQLQSVA